MGCISSKQVAKAAASPIHNHRPTTTATATTKNGSAATMDRSSKTHSVTTLEHEKKGEEKPEDRGRDLKKSKKGSSQGEKGTLRSGPSQRYVEAEQVAAGWPSWLSSAAGEAIQGWVPLRADSFEKLEKVSILHFCRSSLFVSFIIETNLS